jgi:hypothetical protein
MTSFKLFERIESYCLDPSKIYNILRKYQSLQKYNTTYLSLNRFFQLTKANTVPGFQNQASEKTALKLKEGLE